jgi:hypothetical protein
VQKLFYRDCPGAPKASLMRKDVLYIEAAQYPSQGKFTLMSLLRKSFPVC